MKKVIEKITAKVFGTKVLANHTAIKGRKSGGIRDSNGKDWKQTANQTS